MDATPDPTRPPGSRSPDPTIRLEAVSKRYDDGTVAVRELSLDIDEGELAVLVGPSGCGKTTTMKMVNRLVEPSSGRVLVEGEDVAALDPVILRRRIGYVIQQVGLFPHQTVLANAMTVPTLLGWNKKKARARAGELLELVGLDPATHGDRYPHQLSGGQQQRVGVARALAADPPVLLMDEPFGAVDPIARNRLQAEFLRLQDEVNKTIVFVTHDIEEAVRLGDRIAVLRQGGVLEQYADPATLLGQPTSEFVADFVGSDRGLKRLAVTPIERADLEHPPVVLAGDRLADAGAALAAGGDRWGVVVDENGALRGWLGADRASGDGAVGDRAHRMEGAVTVDGTLKEAFSVMLTHDVGWVAVLDGERYCGVLTPGSLYAALRRSVEQAAEAAAVDA